MKSLSDFFRENCSPDEDCTNGKCDKCQTKAVSEWLSQYRSKQMPTNEVEHWENEFVKRLLKDIKKVEGK